MNKRLFALVLSAAATSSHGQTVTAPSVHADDAWTYQLTTERGPGGWTRSKDDFRVSRVTSTGIYLSLKESDSTQPPKDIVLGPDWSRIRSVDGKETVVNRPFSFPLAAGKTWTLDVSEPHPNKRFKWEKRHTQYTVVGSERITVAAGTFEAMKIEAEGTWAGELEPSQDVAQAAQTGNGGTTLVTQVQTTPPGVVSGRTYRAYWYAPEVKRWVKSVEESYSSTGVRTERLTSELVAFAVKP